MLNHIQKGRVFEVVSSGVVAPGAFVLQGSMFGVSINGALASGQTMEVFTGEVFSLPKATGSAWTLGEKLYWDNTALNVTPTSTSNTYIGVAFSAQASGDTAGNVRLNSSF